MKQLTWNEFLSTCKEAWKTEGQGSNQVKTVHGYLLSCEKKPSMTKMQVAASAYKLYKSEEK